MPRCALHPNCHLLHDGLDSDDVGFPPIRVRESTPVSRRAPPSPPNYNSSRRQSSSQSLTSPSPSPQLSRSRRGLGNKNVLNTVRITVHQAKVCFESSLLHPNQWFLGCSKFCRKAKCRISWHCRSSPFEMAVSPHWRRCGLAQARDQGHQTRHDGNRRSYESRLSEGRS